MKLQVLVIALCLLSCGQSYEEQKDAERRELQRLAQEDSAALKVAVLPTAECLPLRIADSCGLFAALGCDIRLKEYTAQMDVDTAIARGAVEVAVTDLVRPLMVKTIYLTATAARWQLITSDSAEVKSVKDLSDKTIAMTRHSATALLTDKVIRGGKLNENHVFPIQVNDLRIRTRMVLGGQIDVAWLPEPFASIAKAAGHQVIKDTKAMNINLGVIVMREDAAADSTRAKQRQAFLTAYDMAVDTINKYGAAHFDARLDSTTTYCHATPPTDEDIKRAKEYIETLRDE